MYGLQEKDNLIVTNEFMRYLKEAYDEGSIVHNYFKLNHIVVVCEVKAYTICVTTNFENRPVVAEAPALMVSRMRGEFFEKPFRL